MARLVIFGAGGFGHEVRLIARDRPVVVMADGRPEHSGILHPSELLPDDEIIIAIGDGATRQRVAASFTRFGSVFAPTAVVGPEVTIGEGAIFADFTLVTTRASIGRHFHCNAYSHVAHDCVIGDFVTLASQVAVNGNTVIEDGVTIGTGAKIRNGAPSQPLVIGEGAIIGMGAVVTKNVPRYATVVGNPARALERRLHAA